ncbi:MAG: sugar ABC transporter ATP-binding protein [Lachnospiraceae bacterium]|nr:sugar ABC transporter ATP-binding protein [Lachnospiraceae bacterium]
MEPYLIEAIDITKRFPGTIANDHICLHVKAGEIMGLVGENGAGKSTILKCLNGVYPYDTYEGEIRIEGKTVQLKNPQEAMRFGIGFVPQEINVLVDMNVAENIFLFDLKNGNSNKLVNHKELRIRAEKLLEETGIELNPNANVRQLSVGQQQMLMIARALATNPKVLILDEPTTSLSGQDVQRLFQVIRTLKKKGVSILFVTHKLAEIMEMTDSLTVMRDGKNISCYERKNYDQNKIVEDMIGRKMTTMYPKRQVSIGEEKLSVKNLCIEHPYIAGRYLVQDFSLTVHAGEVVGLAGLVGAGRSEAAMGIYGELKPSQGEIYIDRQKVEIKSPRDAIDYGIGMVTEDRKKYGLHFGWSIKKNISLSNLKAIVTNNFISNKKESENVMRYYNALSVKATSMNDMVESLSGGNQQKVVIARTLNALPKVVILDEPTKGIDVGAKAEIYELINKLAEQGVAVILISSELPELMAMSDRFIVMAEGHISGELNKEEATEAGIMTFATRTFKEF